MNNSLHEDLEKSLIVELEISVRNNTGAPELRGSRSYADVHTPTDQTAYAH